MNNCFWAVGGFPDLSFNPLRLDGATNVWIDRRGANGTEERLVFRSTHAGMNRSESNDHTGVLALAPADEIRACAASYDLQADPNRKGTPAVDSDLGYGEVCTPWRRAD